MKKLLAHEAALGAVRPEHRLRLTMSLPPSDSSLPTTFCYRHNDRPSGVICQRCDRPICSSCMTQASVGVHCPECVKGNKQKVYTRTSLPGSRGTVTYAIMGLNVAAFLLQIVLFDGTITDDGRSARELAIWGPAIANGEWYRIITSGFLHFGIIHLAMNMYSLYHLGPVLERSMGPVRFSLAYAAALVGGAVGALVESPNALTMGASGAIFGLLGLLVMMFRDRGIGLNQSGLGQVLLLNAFISFSGFVSLGGHAGGFIVGIVLGILYWGANPGDKPVFGNDQRKPDVVTVAVIVGLFVLAIVIA